MLYVIVGDNSYEAAKKILAIKAAFQKKTGDKVLVEEVDGDIDKDPNLAAIFGQGTLFAKAKLVVLKNILNNKKTVDFFKENIEDIRFSKHIFLLWERELETKLRNFLAGRAEKIQESKRRSRSELEEWFNKKSKSFGVLLDVHQKKEILDSAGENAEWAIENKLNQILLGGELLHNSKTDSNGNVFYFVNKILSVPLSGALFTVKEAAANGFGPEQLIYPLLWSIKQRKLADIYWQGIQTESAIMRKDTKRASEHLERFILFLKRPECLTAEF